MESLSKNKIKLVRSLQRKKFRDEYGMFVLEGLKSVLEAIEQHPDLIEFIVSPEDSKRLHPEHYSLPESELKKISGLTSSTGWLAVLKKPEIESDDSDFIVVLDGIQDPGNLGTIIRTCDWFGIHRIVCSKDSADCFNVKTVQATMGSIFRVEVEYADLQEFLGSFDGPIYGALMEGEDVFKSDYQPKGALVLGNEGNGVRPEIQSLITHPLHIPGKGKAESLNVAIAAGILIAELKGRSL
ncbi:MAG: TrmH family RNA methyltransferase [Crocinitomicaceae bacterium]